MFRFLIKVIKKLIKWTLIGGVAVIVIALAWYFIWQSSLTDEEKAELAEKREAREKERVEQIARKEKEEKEAQELKLLSTYSPTPEQLEEAIKIASSNEDVTYLSCPAMRVTEATHCGYASELSILGRDHCGEGYRPGKDLGDYFVILSKSIADQDHQRHLVAIVDPETGRISTRGGTPKDRINTYDNTNFYYLSAPNTRVELDRRSLVLSISDSIPRYARPQTYGIVEGFSVDYPYEAETKCASVENRDLLADLINGAALRRQEMEKQRLKLEQEKKERLIKEQEEREQSLKSKNKI